MRYGRVAPLNVARMARQADAHGQLGLAVHLFALAAWLDGQPDPDLSLPSLNLNDVEKGHAVLNRGKENVDA